ncbi:MAG: hypothetical protein KAH13_01275 [Tenericutes bacterium]|nr:hypothetical protein [Mycoplasmatota bacterium]
MNRKLLLIFFIINIIAVFTIIIFVSDNAFVNILLAIYLMIFASTFYYINRKKN